MPRTVVARSGEDVRAITARAGDAKSIGWIIARILESQAQRAFIEQKLGEWEWPERYPNMDDPFVNLAALVNYTNSGGTILSRFFDRRPALMGVSQPGLANSFSASVEGSIVEVGSALPYAGIHQWGGRTRQPITDETKAKVAKFIGEEKTPDGKWRKKKRISPKVKAQREQFWLRLSPLLGADELDTEVVQRPFLGITKQNEEEIQESIEHWIATGEQ